ncbi:MAG: cation:proton antiporter [Candidatus Methylomirabilia bacterium]
MEIINLNLALAALVSIGFVGAVIARRIGVPMITGYLAIGMLLSPSVFPLLPKELLTDATAIITPLALGVIAYLIGGSLHLPSLARFGRDITFVTLFEGMGAWVGVTVLIFLLGPWLITSGVGDGGLMVFFTIGITGGAISLATAPAGTLAVIREYRSRGPLTTILLSVVALDDALAIMATAVALAVISFLLGDGASWVQLLLGATGEIGFSLLLGGGIALGLISLSQHTRRRSELLVVVLGAILLCLGVAEMLHLSYLLATMALGFVVVNRLEDSQQLFSVVYDLEELLYALFFTLVGTKLDLSLFASGGVLALLIVAGRMAGKFSGATLGATLSGAPPAVRKYLGLGLLAKAGVTVGLALLVEQDPRMAGVAAIFVNGVLASTIVNQLIAPPLVKVAIVRSGEVGRADAAPAAEEHAERRI